MPLSSGGDGRVVGSRHFAGATAASIVGDAQAAASSAKSATMTVPQSVEGRLAVVSKVGPEPEIQAGQDGNASIVLTTYNLTTGLPLWEMPILSAAHAAQLSPHLAVGASVSRVGDVDGDGVEDLQLRVEHHLDGNLQGVPAARTGGLA